MNELMLQLESKINEVLQKHKHLKQSNFQLHQGKSLLIHEKELLQAKQKKAIMQIESLVSKLKTIEKTNE